MGIKHWNVNIDYESQLFDSDYSPLKYEKFNKSLEHIFFYINKDSNSSLLPIANYSEKYLKSIESLGFLSPRISSSKESVSSHNWWGALNDLELERKLNSKLYTIELAQNLNLPSPKQWAVNQVSDLQKRISENEDEIWLLRNPYKMSGQGAHIFQKSRINKYLKLFEKTFNQTPMVLNNYCERILDIGFTFNLDEGKREVFFIINRIDNNLSFNGGEFYLDEVDFYREYPELDLENLMKDLRVHLGKVVQHCQDLGALGFLQVDTFIYRDSENKIQVNPLVEINYRRTMGQLLYAFKPFAKKKIILKRAVVDKNSTKGIIISPSEFSHQLYVETI
jgi:hypothetical protein